MKRNPSIIQTEKKSYLSGRTDSLEAHESLKGSSDRQIAIREGLWIWVTADEHRWLHHTEEGQKRDYEICAEQQRIWLEYTGKSREDWYRLFYKFYD